MKTYYSVIIAYILVIFFVLLIRFKKKNIIICFSSIIFFCLFSCSLHEQFVHAFYNFLHEHNFCGNIYKEKVGHLYEYSYAFLVFLQWKILFCTFDIDEVVNDLLCVLILCASLKCLKTACFHRMNKGFSYESSYGPSKNICSCKQLHNYHTSLLLLHELP